MRKRYYVTLGAATTAGGKLVSASHVDTIDGAGVALAGDRIECPACGTEGLVQPDGRRLPESSEGRALALDGDLCACACHPPPRLLASQRFAFQWLGSIAAE